MSDEPEERPPKWKRRYAKHQEHKTRDVMSEIELQMDDVRLMAWTISKIGSIERAEKALRRLSDTEPERSQ